MPLSVPDSETRTCTITVGEAYLMALDGEFGRGLHYLHWGLSLAICRADGASPWADGLMKRWKHEINLYCEIFGDR